MPVGIFMDTVQYLFTNLLLELPVLLVTLAGCALSLFYRRRYPAASVLSLCGFLLYFLQSVFGLGLYGLLPGFLEKQGWQTDATVSAMRAVHFIQSLVIAISMALLLAAVFRGRSAQPEIS